MKKIGKNFFLLTFIMLLIPIINVKADENDFNNITGTDALIKGTNYEISYEDNKIILSNNANVELRGDAQKYRIIINENANVTITLNNYKADTTEGGWKNTIDLQDGSSVILNLIGENTLKAGQESSTIKVPKNTSLEINGDGSLFASVDNSGSVCLGAVIGSIYNYPFGNIVINGGNIYTSYDGKYSSGIGNGYCSKEHEPPVYTPEGTITLNGGNIHTDVLGYAITDSEEQSQVVLEGNGNAIVYTESDMRNLNAEGFNGIIFDEHGNGIVKGNATLNQDLEITGSLTVEDGASLTIPEGVTVTNKGTITNNGSIKNTGTIDNKEGRIDNTSSGTIESATNIEGTEGIDIKPILYNIDINVGPGGTVNSNSSQIKHGEDIIIKIYPNYGYKIQSIIVNGEDKTSEVIEGTLILEHITQDTSIEISFEKLPYSSSTQPEKTEDTETPPDPETTISEPNNTQNNVSQDVANPQTSDRVITYTILQLLSLIGFINLEIYLKKSL